MNRSTIIRRTVSINQTGSRYITWYEVEVGPEKSTRLTRRPTANTRLHTRRVHMNTSRIYCSHASLPTLFVKNACHSWSESCTNAHRQEKLNEAVLVLNKSLQVRTGACAVDDRLLSRQPQEINIKNMNVELVAQMFKNYQSNVLFHLEGQTRARYSATQLTI